jgi:hypothetical protein
VGCGHSTSQAFNTSFCLQTIRHCFSKLKSWARKLFCNSPQIENLPHSQIRKFLRSVRKSQIYIFVVINPEIANPKISLVSQSANPQVCKEKIRVSDPDPHWFASICKEKNYVFVDLRKF